VTPADTYIRTSNWAEIRRRSGYSTLQPCCRQPARLEEAEACKTRVHVDALKGIDNVDVGLRTPADSQAFCHFPLCSAPPWASVALQSFMAYTSLPFFTACSLNLGPCNHRYPSTTALVSAELSDGGASASMLITLRSFPVITIRPIEADDSSFRILGKNAILFVCFRGKTPDLTFTPSQLELAWPWLSFLCWKSDLPECSDDFPPFHSGKHIQFHKYLSHGIGA
jgi:hypothetical protein